VQSLELAMGIEPAVSALRYPVSLETQPFAPSPGVQREKSPLDFFLFPSHPADYKTNL